MTAEQLIKDRMKERGYTITQLADETGYEYELVRRSIAGKRAFKPNELVDVLTTLGITAEELAGTGGWEYANAPA